MSEAEVEVGVRIFKDEEREAREREEEEEEAQLDKSIRHDVIPESDSDSECEFRNLSIQPVQRSDGNMFVGQIFNDKEAFAEAVLDHALKNGRNIKQYRYDKTKIGYCCVGGNCEWRVYCAKVAKCDQWEVRVFKDIHICVPNGECELMKVPVIATLFHDRIRDDPEYYMPMKIKEVIMEKWKINVSRGQCQAARNKALKWIGREYDMQFEIRHYRNRSIGTQASFSTTVSEEEMNKSKQHKRKKGVNESPTKKAPLKKRVMHCGVCGAANHNSRFHAVKGGDSYQGGEPSQMVPFQGESSQSEPSQGIISHVP